MNSLRAASEVVFAGAMTLGVCKLYRLYEKQVTFSKECLDLEEASRRRAERLSAEVERLKYMAIPVKEMNPLQKEFHKMNEQTRIVQEKSLTDFNKKFTEIPLSEIAKNIQDGNEYFEWFSDSNCDYDRVVKSDVLQKFWAKQGVKVEVVRKAGVKQHYCGYYCDCKVNPYLQVKFSRL